MWVKEERGLLLSPSLCLGPAPPVEIVHRLPGEAAKMF